MVNLDVCICSSRLACQVKHRLFLLIYFVRGTLESYSIPVVFTMLPKAFSNASPQTTLPPVWGEL